jgi:hypothetical protein
VTALARSRSRNKTSDDCYNSHADPPIDPHGSEFKIQKFLEDNVKGIFALLLALLLFVSISVAQNAPAPPAARTDVYHVHFAKAALGKAAEEGEFLKTQAPGAPMKGHLIVLRHQDGEDWDYVVIEHLGTKATVEAAGTQVPPAMRDLSAWHVDTFVNGPSWREFSKAMGIDEASAAKTAGSVYVVSVYRAAPGHRDQLEKALSQTPAGGTSSGNVLMQHLEGGPWLYLTVARYNSWQDFATNEKNSVPDTLKAGGGWLELRNHSTYHNDTLTDRIAP